MQTIKQSPLERKLSEETLIDFSAYRNRKLGLSESLDLDLHENELLDELDSSIVEFMSEENDISINNILTNLIEGEENYIETYNELVEAEIEHQEMLDESDECLEYNSVISEAYFNQDRKKEKAPKIKKVFQKYGVKGTLGVQHYSTFQINIMSGEIPLEEFDGGGDINHYWYERNDKYSKRVKSLFKELLEIANEGNHDRSDSMTDYFDVGWYVDLKVGKHNKPYQYIEKGQKAVKDAKYKLHTRDLETIVYHFEYQSVTDKVRKISEQLLKDEGISSKVNLLKVKNMAEFGFLISDSGDKVYGSFHAINYGRQLELRINKRGKKIEKDSKLYVEVQLDKHGFYESRMVGDTKVYRLAGKSMRTLDLNLVEKLLGTKTNTYKGRGGTTLFYDANNDSRAAQNIAYISWGGLRGTELWVKPTAPSMSKSSKRSAPKAAPKVKVQKTSTKQETKVKTTKKSSLQKGIESGKVIDFASYRKKRGLTESFDINLLSEIDSDIVENLADMHDVSYNYVLFDLVEQKEDMINQYNDLSESESLDEDCLELEYSVLNESSKFTQETKKQAAPKIKRVLQRYGLKGSLGVKSIVNKRYLGKTETLIINIKSGSITPYDFGLNDRRTFKTIDFSDPNFNNPMHNGYSDNVYDFIMEIKEVTIDEHKDDRSGFSNFNVLVNIGSSGKLYKYVEKTTSKNSIFKMATGLRSGTLKYTSTITTVDNKAEREIKKIFKELGKKVDVVELHSNDPKYIIVEPSSPDDKKVVGALWSSELELEVFKRPHRISKWESIMVDYVPSSKEGYTQLDDGFNGVKKYQITGTKTIKSKKMLSIISVITDVDVSDIDYQHHSGEHFYKIKNSNFLLGTVAKEGNKLVFIETLDRFRNIKKQRQQRSMQPVNFDGYTDDELFESESLSESKLNGFFKIFRSSQQDEDHTYYTIKNTTKVDAKMLKEVKQLFKSHGTTVDIINTSTSDYFEYIIIDTKISKNKKVVGEINITDGQLVLERYRVKDFDKISRWKDDLEGTDNEKYLVNESLSESVKSFKFRL